MVIGDGVIFMNRDLLYPVGRERWTRGTIATTAFLLMARNYDGTDPARAIAAMRDWGALSLNENPGQFQFGVISQAEIDLIKAGVSEVIEGRLLDVEDHGEEIVMRLGDDRRVPVESGTWFVNCTGFILRREPLPFEPYVSTGERVLSINPSSLVFFLGSFSGYFLGHLLYRDLLSTVPLYQLPADQLVQHAKADFGAAGASQAVLNQLLLMKALPTSVFKECQLDFNRWYPLHRQLPVLAQMMVNSRRYQAECRAALDELGRRTGIEIGPLAHVHAGSPARATA
jgi:hypothetical protein